MSTLTEHHTKNEISITVIMPVYNGSLFLRDSLSPLIAMLENREVLEVFVVDDNSTDDSADIALNLGARLLRTGSRRGPGAARNFAAERAEGDVLWFVDSDVVVHSDAACRLRKQFSDATVTAVFGTYDDHPPAPNFLSQYKNLAHRFYHQYGKREASTFWAGCGAVRKREFLQAGGFDSERYDCPSIEDIEFGYRLQSKNQRIILNPSIQGTHLKHWRFFNLIHTEIMRRAIPWSRLMLQKSGMVDDLNVSIGERLRAILAVTLVLALIGAFPGFVAWWFPAFVLVVTVAGNWKLIRYFYHHKGLLFTVGALLFHQIYYLYSSAAYVWVWLEQLASRVRYSKLFKSMLSISGFAK